MTDSSVFIRSNIVWNQWGSTLKSLEARSIWASLNQGTANSVILATFSIKGNTQITVARSLFTMNEHLYLCFQLGIIYVKNILLQISEYKTLTAWSTNKTKKTTGDRALFVAAPTLWNALPDELRALGSLKTFMARLKTHYFKLAFNL